MAVAGRRCGGRFWALAEEDSADELEEEIGSLPPAGVASPPPSDMLCKSLALGYMEEEVSACVDTVVPRDDPVRRGLGDGEQLEVLRRVAHRRTAATVIRPWRGPIPKVRPPTVTLQDFFDTGKWTMVTRRKRRPAGPEQRRRAERQRWRSRSKRIGRPNCRR